MRNYEKIFAARGNRYDDAMRRFPNARNEEFRQLLSKAALNGTEHIADVPAGGGYLKPFLPDSCRWFGHEPCSSFTSHGVIGAFEKDLLPLPWENTSMDVVVSLAGVHHIENKRPLFLEMHRITKSGGRLVLSDVEADSAVADFLDNYVGKFNSTGHDGEYLSEETSDVLAHANWIVKSSEVINFQWRFSSNDQLEAFCNELFDICDAPKGQTTKAVSELLGISTVSGKHVAMNWSLRTIVCEKPK